MAPLSLADCRKYLPKDCALCDEEILALRNQMYALAEFICSVPAATVRDWQETSINASQRPPEASVRPDSSEIAAMILEADTAFDEEKEYDYTMIYDKEGPNVGGQ